MMKLDKIPDSLQIFWKTQISPPKMSKNAPFQWDCRRVVAKIGQKSHQHTEIELNFVESGALVYQHGAEVLTIRSGEVALFWAALPHHIIHTEADTVLDWLTIPFSAFLAWDLPDALVGTLMDGQLLKFDYVDISKRADVLFDSWRQEIGTHGTSKQAVAKREVEAFINRLSLHLPASPDTSQKPPSITMAQKIARFITQHYSELLTIEQIAQAVDLNPNYAMTLFRQQFNMSILEYLTQFRVAHAQRLLLFGDLPIDDIALQSGFGSISQFYATFKRAVGTTPHRYRQLRNR